MKHLLTITAVIAALVGTAFAGPAPSFKKTVMEPRPEVYGLGWYGALQAGVNALQGLDEPTIPVGGGINTIAHSEVGGFGGAKLGYVFDTGKIRPAIEGDLFYNGFGFNYQIPTGGAIGGIGYAGSVNSLAYLVNGLVRFDLGRFQPYVGAGIGGYYANFDINSGLFPPALTAAVGNLSRDNTSWAWQVIAGADYYFTERVSLFAEYKYLTYMDFTYFKGFGPVGKIQNDLDQHLFGIGVRLHF